jgi:hypothetical protein
LQSDQSAPEIECEFTVIGWLTGNRIPGAAIGEISHAVRVLARDIERRSKLHQRTQGIAYDLTEQAAHCTVE